MKILKYLVKTKGLKLIFTDNKINVNKLDCMVNSDFAGDSIDRKSTTWYIICSYGNLIYWISKKQSTVIKNRTQCSTFAEYIAMSKEVTEILFFKVY